jgi:hypothetical protein
MLRLLVGVLPAPALQGLDQVLVKWNGLLRGLGLAGADHLAPASFIARLYEGKKPGTPR